MSKQALLFLTTLFLSSSAIFSGGAAQAGPINWAQVIKLVNKVQFKPTNASWRPAQNADRLQQSGEALFTSRGGRADLRLSEGSLLRMSSNTHLWIQPNSRNLLQRSGTALYVIKPGGGRTDISTPYGRAGVRGSALFVRVNEETSTMIVGALTNNPAGPMEVTVDNGPKQRLEAGQMAVVRGGQITMFEFDLNKFYQTSSLVQGFGLDGKAVTSDDATLADPEIQQTLQAVQAETIPALLAQKPVVGTDVAVNPVFLNSSSRDLKPADLIMQATAGGFDPNSSQTAAEIAAARQGVNGSRNPAAAVAAPIVPVPPLATVPAPAIGATQPANGTIVPLAPATVAPPTTVVNPTPPVATPANPVTPTVPDRTLPTATPANPVTPTPSLVQPVGQPNNPQLPVIQPIVQPVPAGQVGSQTPSVIPPISQPVPGGSVSSPSSPSRVEPVTSPVRPVTTVIIRVEVESSKSPRVEPVSTPSRVETGSTPVVPPIAPAAPVTPVTAPVVNNPITTTPDRVAPISTPTVVQPASLPVVPPIAPATPVVPVTPVVHNLITPEAPSIPSLPRVEPVSTPAVVQPTLTPPVTPTPVVQSTVTPPVTPTPVVQSTVTPPVTPTPVVQPVTQPPVTTTLDRVAPVSTPAVIQPILTPTIQPTVAPAVIQPTLAPTVQPTAAPAVITAPPVAPVETPVVTTPDPKLTAPQ